MIMYTYAGPLGTFWICHEDGGSWKLGIGAQTLGIFASPEEAADRVVARSTGYLPWDDRDIQSELPNLEDWKHDVELEPHLGNRCQGALPVN